MGNIRSHKELTVWQDAMDAAMDIFAVTKAFPPEEKYALVDQIRRSSRSVPANISEAWRKRRYEAAFKSKLNDAESKQVKRKPGLSFALRCSYVDRQTAESLDQKYEHIAARLVTMIRDSGNWTLR